MSVFADARYDPPAVEDYFCPVCGSENPWRIYTDWRNIAVGCDLCLAEHDAQDYFAGKEEEHIL